MTVRGSLIQTGLCHGLVCQHEDLGVLYISRLDFPWNFLDQVTQLPVVRQGMESSASLPQTPSVGRNLEENVP
jgi:hypothetical protein